MNKKKGAFGEKIAKKYLEKLDYRIIEQNWTCRWGAIDLIAWDDDELVFIEVKKPNNHDGILAEHKRLKTRFRNKKFRNFVNITQLMVFSNNMEYDDNSPAPIEGAFYATPSYREPVFNYFREEDKFDLDSILSVVDEATETEVLKDTNLLSIKNAPEFLINKNPDIF